jgi:hypothetical protein
LITNSLPHFDALTNEVLLGKVGDGSKGPGAGQGSYSQDRVSPSMDTAFSTMMLGATTGGDPYTFSKYDRMLRKVGFSRNELRELLQPRSV